MQRTFALLDHRVIFTTDRTDWLERLDDIVVRADDRLPVRRTLHLRLVAGADGIRIEHAGPAGCTRRPKTWTWPGCSCCKPSSSPAT